MGVKIRPLWSTRPPCSVGDVDCVSNILWPPPLVLTPMPGPPAPPPVPTIAIGIHSGEHKLKAEIGIIGGSGLYTMPGFESREELNITTPFGSPSDNYVLGTLAGRNVAFLARHGRGHRLSP